MEASQPGGDSSRCGAARSSGSGTRGLEHAEVDFDRDAHRNRFAVLHRRLEAVPANGFEGLFIETHTQGLNDMGILRIAVSIDDE